LLLLLILLLRLLTMLLLLLMMMMMVVVISADSSESSPQLTSVPDSVTINTPVTFGYQTVPNLDLSGRSRVEFSVQEATDAHVMLTMQSGGVFEVVIGGWGNTKSVIRRARAGADIVSANGAVLSATEFRTFVLDWSTPGVLKLFTKSSSGTLTQILATPQQPESVLDITTMAVSSFTCTGIYKIQVSARHFQRIQRRHVALLAFPIPISNRLACTR
jgi:hypothetical protein